MAELRASTCDESTLKMKRSQALRGSNVEKCAQHMSAGRKITDLRISHKPNPDEDDECQIKMINPDVNRPQEVATPEECLKADFGQVAKRRFFIYSKSNPPTEGKPILEDPMPR